MITMSDPKKIILKSIASVSGKTEKDIKKDLNVGKKTKKRKKYNNDASVDIICQKANIIDFSNIKGSNKKYSVQNDVFKWTLKDVSLYAKNKYQAIGTNAWIYKPAGASIEFSKLHDKLLDILGFCNFLVLKNYVDYIFDKFIDEILVQGKGTLYLKNIRNPKYLNSFCYNYNYNRSLQVEKAQQESKDKAKENIQQICHNDIKDVFLLNEERAVKEYGIIISIFWLIRQNSYKNGEASSKILDICKKIEKKGDFNIVKEKTEYFSPYSKELYFPKMQEFLKSLDKEYKIDIIYTDDANVKNKFNF